MKRLEIEKQKKVKLKELEFRKAYDVTQQENRNENCGMRNGNNLGQNNNAKYVKMPISNKERDCLDDEV